MRGVLSFDSDSASVRATPVYDSSARRQLSALTADEFKEATLIDDLKHGRQLSAPTAEEDATSPEGRAASADAADMLVGGRE